MSAVGSGELEETIMVWEGEEHCDCPSVKDNKPRALLAPSEGVIGDGDVMVDHATARRSLDTREDRGAPAKCVISNVIWSVLGTQVGV